MKRRFFLIFVIFSFLLSSCVTVKKLNQLEPVYVTNTKQINILMPENLSSEIDTLMLMEFCSGEQKFTAPAYIIADYTGIFITILNDFGVDMGTIEFDGNAVFLECPVIPQKLKGEYLINEFQNAFYDFDTLKSNLKASKLEIICEEYDEKVKRIIKDGSNIIEEITIFANGEVNIENFLRNYSIRLSY